ncbi:MAG: PfaD family polyunsaturated fatty acid/polyketide biosynthesis protein [Desulfobacterales bacterium]|nr:PfaD family polyunsaturated fatty acid/polyketide biosynthesis protein [Desulfobacterales bacterium]
MLQAINNNRPGWWKRGNSNPEFGNKAIRDAILNVSQPVFLLDMGGDFAVGHGGSITIGSDLPFDTEGHPLCAYVPPLTPEDLGDNDFKRFYGIRYAYIAGAMAKGITSVEMVQAAGKAGMLGFFGAGGLSVSEIEKAIDRLRNPDNDFPFGFNLIHNPSEPDQEMAVVKLYLDRGIALVSASAYLDLTLPLVLYRVKGIHRSSDNRIVCPNKVIAKVSRIEVARKFLSPPPEKLLAQLVENNLISEEEAELAVSIPMADDITAEADSGGHTDNRPAMSLLPTLLALRDEMVGQYTYQRIPCIGLGGGIATPDSTAAAFAMGAAYVLTGSVNQACIESGTSETVRKMLCDAKQADVTMAPAADMFEMGVKVQVLKRGTMFPFRASRLYDLYKKYDSLESLPEKEILTLERDYFRSGLENVWSRTKAFFLERDPNMVTRAEQDPKFRMALVFRSYLGQATAWANCGEPSRKIDYQIWCGPAIGAFNEWVKGSFLEKSENRKFVSVAMNLLFGAAFATRMNWLKSQKVSLPPGVGKFSPLDLDQINNFMEEQQPVL